MFNYRLVVVITTLVGVIGKIHDTWVYEMANNPVGSIIKIIGVIVLVIVLYGDDALLQAKDC